MTLPRFIVDRDAASPVHVQIASWINDLVNRGLLQPGDRLPSERDLAESLGISRMTLRQSLAELERRGVLSRTGGRSGGSFIEQPRLDLDLTALAGFTDLVRQAHQKAGAKVLVATTEPATRDVAGPLHLVVGDHVHRIDRLRTANRVPVALERSWLPAREFPGLLDLRLAGSLYRLLDKHFARGPVTADEYLSPMIADGETARTLAVEPGAPLMLLERTARDADSRPVEYARDIYRGDRLRLLVRRSLT